MEANGNAFIYDRLLPIGEDSPTGSCVEPIDAGGDEQGEEEIAGVAAVIELSDGDGEASYISLAVEGIAQAVEGEDDADEALLNLAATTDLELENCGEKKIWPWMEARAKANTPPLRSPLLQLHQEILDFCKFISPTEEEELERVAAIQRVSNAIKSIWPYSKFEIFGSYATGLYLPTSDVDAVILDSGCEDIQKGLKAISRELRRRDLARKITIIAKARVPIIKFVEAGSGISFDISFDLRNGPEAAKFIQRAIETLPPLRPLCMVLKIFLQQRELNEVYCGGIGSYGLLVMLMTHLQMHPSRKSSGVLEANLGVLLLDFFALYGRALNMKDVGVSCADGGRFFLKATKGFVDYKRVSQLAIEDPQARENDIGKNSFQIAKVRAAFVLAHRLLSSFNPSATETAGILGRIIRGDSILTSRKRYTTSEVVAETYFFDGKKQERRESNPETQKKSKHRKRNKPKHDDDKSKQHNKRETEKRRKRKRDDVSTGKTKWRKVEESPSPRMSRTSTYTDHCDHDSVNTGQVVASSMHKRFKHS